MGSHGKGTGARRPRNAARLHLGAFAGEEAITSYHMVNAETGVPRGGISVEDGSGWKVEPAVEQMVAGCPASCAGRPKWRVSRTGAPSSPGRGSC